MTKIKPIKPELRPLIEDFINFEEYQPIFKQFAAVIGYHGTDKKKIQKLLFLPNAEGDIAFSISGMDELFLEFQMLKQLIDKEPYASLLEEYPESIQNIRIVSQKILKGSDISEEDLVLIFDTDVYDKRRATVDAAAAEDSKQV